MKLMHNKHPFLYLNNVDEKNVI